MYSFKIFLKIENSHQHDQEVVGNETQENNRSNQPNDQIIPVRSIENPWINEVIQKIEYRQKELTYHKTREIEENWWRFFIIDRFQNVKYQDKSDSQKLEYQLSTLGSYIKITEKEIRVTLKWDDLWENFLKVLLIPIEGITFDIRLIFCDVNWKKFTETFIKMFTPLKESGSKITYIHLKKKRNYWRHKVFRWCW